MDTYIYERELREKGIKLIAGVDEVGRGPLVGPVVTACVILPEKFDLEGLTDSKKLSEKKREILYKEIEEHIVEHDSLLLQGSGPFFRRRTEIGLHSSGGSL